MADSKQDKIWADALRRAVMRRIEGEEGKPQKIERIADKVVELALDGKVGAIKEIGDRLDGKPKQTTDANVSLKGSLKVVKEIVRPT